MPPKKAAIPATVRNIVWKTYNGDAAEARCHCCKIEPITRANFACGHIIAESKGGSTTVENLRPICVVCNSSMGTQNMDDFMKKYGIGSSIPTTKTEAEPITKVAPDTVTKKGKNAAPKKKAPAKKKAVAVDSDNSDSDDDPNVDDLMSDMYLDELECALEAKFPKKWNEYLKIAGMRTDVGCCCAPVGKNKFCEDGPALFKIAVMGPDKNKYNVSVCAAHNLNPTCISAIKFT